MTKNDYVIICGDFGGIWSLGVSNKEEEYWLNWLSKKQFTILFVDGNHENFDRLKEFPRVNFCGGKAHKIRDNIYHLMRGYIFELEGKKFFTFGGARSHDIDDGILDPNDFADNDDFYRTFLDWKRKNKIFRINHLSWWAEELPSTYEMKRGIENLKKVNFEVDYVISHCLPLNVISSLYKDSSDKLTKYFDKLVFGYGLKFKQWHAGHYHTEKRIYCQYDIHYKKIVRLL